VKAQGGGEDRGLRDQSELHPCQDAGSRGACSGLVGGGVKKSRSLKSKRKKTLLQASWGESEGPASLLDGVSVGRYQRKTVEKACFTQSIDRKSFFINRYKILQCEVSFETGRIEVCRTRFENKARSRGALGRKKNHKGETEP